MDLNFNLVSALLIERLRNENEDANDAIIQSIF